MIVKVSVLVGEAVQLIHILVISV